MGREDHDRELTDLVQRLREVNWVCHTYGKTEIKHDTVCHEAADAIEAQAKRIAELEHQLKVECDTYLWNRKRMSRRIAMLEYWMEKLFKYGSSPEARRNQMTMTTEIPDCLMREGEDILLETATFENGDE